MSRISVKIALCSCSFNEIVSQCTFIDIIFATWLHFLKNGSVSNGSSSSSSSSYSSSSTSSPSSALASLSPLTITNSSWSDCFMGFPNPIWPQEKCKFFVIRLIFVPCCLISYAHYHWKFFCVYCRLYFFSITLRFNPHSFVLFGLNRFRNRYLKPDVSLSYVTLSFLAHEFPVLGFLFPLWVSSHIWLLSFSFATFWFWNESRL